MSSMQKQPGGAFVGASWAALLTGAVAYLAGLWNSALPLNERGYYFTILAFGLFAAVSLQKSVRDQVEGIPVGGLYLGICWAALALAIGLMVVGLWHAGLLLSEKGFFGMAFVLCLFAAVVVQKNVRDGRAAQGIEGDPCLAGCPRKSPVEQLL